MKWLEMAHRLPEGGIFTPGDIRSFLGLTEESLHKLIWRYTRKGLLVKLRNGLYFLSRGVEPPAFAIANRLYSPSYISFESALSHYGIMPESVYSVISATSKATREFDANNRNFIYRKIKRTAFTGYRPVKMTGATVLIAEPEKAYVDMLYFRFLRKTDENDRIDKSRLSIKEVSKYISVFENDDFKKWSAHVI